MSKKFQIRSSSSDSCFELSHFDGDFFTASISGTGRAGELRICGYQYSPPMPEFFQDLAKNWKGWDGEKSWESLEGDLDIFASSDKLGHVTLTFRLGNANRGLDEDWVLVVKMSTEAGLLDDIASGCSDFFKADG